MPVAYGPPDISGLEKKIDKLRDAPWYQKWWGQILIGIIVAVASGTILALIL